MHWIYLDNNATTQPAESVRQAMHDMAEHAWANPSSVHRFGQSVRQRVELARDSVARLIRARPRDVIFTSGGTEANNLALHGTLPPTIKSRTLITTPIEHSAIREPAEQLARTGTKVIQLPLDPHGRVQPQALHETLLQYAGDVTLVSIHWANNETGVIEPIPELLQCVTQFRQTHPDRTVLFHTDATQAVGKIPVDVTRVPVDLLTMSAHKFHGPKGVGALYVRRAVRLTPVQRGGPQERERRGGTENTFAIVAMGVAAELAESFLADESAVQKCRAMRDRFEQTIAHALPDAVIHAQHAERLWNTSNIGFPRLEAEAILLALSERGVCASAGAACSSGSLEPSPVLLAMSIPEPIAHGSVRFSLSRYTTDAEIDEAVKIIPDVVQRIGQTLPSL